MTPTVTEYYNKFQDVYNEVIYLKKNDPENPKVESLISEMEDLRDKTTALIT